ncbi:hypothetical protein GTQ40_15420 [Flavobacteriaceae bacterium R38]|nr:hypothetical protein [Flavobacteriaceae bacterium R38]
MKKTNFTALTMLIFLCMCLFINTSNAQDYTKQIEALKLAFKDKSPEKLLPYISSELAFEGIPPAMKSQILNQIFSQIPLKTLSIKETKKGQALINYDIQGLGNRASAIHFDNEGKITKIELVDNLIKQGQERQRQQQQVEQSANAVQPVPDELAKKYPAQKVTFAASDEVIVTGNLYEIDKNKPVILLCHQAGYNKYEYADIAPKLNELGYNALAVDLRGGGTFAAHTNETIETATKKGQDVNGLNAEKDIAAAIDYLNKRYHQKVIVWGSSYSSSFALFAAAENKKVKASISFSPGDYFGDNKPSLAKILPALNKPFFITSSKREAAGIKDLLKNTKLRKGQVHFIPKDVDGAHGARVLWNGQDDNDAAEYWPAIKQFLNTL